MTSKGRKLHELRRSNAAGPHKDRRAKRLQTRQSRKTHAIEEQQ
jgi:hypothetical protein